MKKQFYINNRENIAKTMKENSIMILHSGVEFAKSGDQNYPFSVNRNFYYLTGVNQSNAIVAIIKSEGIKEYLFIEENDPVQVKWMGAKLYKNEAKDISGIDNIYYVNQFKHYLFNFLNPSRAMCFDLKTIYFDLERRNDLTYKTWSAKEASKIKKEYPELLIKNIYKDIITLRSAKHQYEIDLMKESIDVTSKALQNVMKNIKPNMYEYQMETYYDSVIKYNKNKEHAFQTICAGGKNATVLHYVDNDYNVKENELVLFDLGCQTDFYCSDISRTYPVSGKFTKRQKEIYEIVLNCNKECIKFLKAGITWKEYNDFANKLLIAGLKKIGLITEDKELRNYYWHSIGHSLGLDTHDPNDSSKVICENMILTVEPGLYLEDEGIGIRIEDDILITKDGAINLSSNIIKEIDDIEKFMKNNNK